MTDSSPLLSAGSTDLGHSTGVTTVVFFAGLQLEWPLLVLLVPCLLCATTGRRSKQRLAIGESRLLWII